MARHSTTGGKASRPKGRKASNAKAPKTSPAKGRKGTAKAKRRIVPKATQRKGRSDSDLQEQRDRYFNELKEAREQQAASAEILKVINASPGDQTPVFDIILEKAHSLCDVTTGSLEIHEGDRAFAVAVRGVNRRWEEFLRLGYKIDDSNRERVQAVHPIQIVDVCEVLERSPDNPVLRAMVEIGGLRGLLALPLIKDGRVFGRIIAARDEVRPFTNHQIALLQTFADQTVIAIENTRLFNETKESLRQQTATADVLKVISRSAFDLDVVLQTLTESATRLCGADFGVLFQPEADGAFAPTASDNMPPVFLAALKAKPIQPGDGSLTGRVLQERRVLQMEDLHTTPGYRSDLASVANFHTMLSVPLLKDGEPVLLLTIARAGGSRAFTEQQIDLLTTFGDQAVIAIENARLLTEQREALERQTATADILKVIASSPDDVQPVFDAIVRTAVRLLRCDVVFVLRSDGQTFSPAAAASQEGPLSDMGLPILPIDPEHNFPSRAILAKEMLHLPDWSTIDLPEHERQIQALIGVNSALYLPLLRQGECIGLIVYAAARPNIFGPSEIALAESFRDQALIAIENTRLFSETKEALEQQKASAEILSVISSSVSDTAPVFEKILDSCQRLFGTDRLAIHLVGDDNMVRVAAWRFAGEVENDVVPLDRSITGQVIRDRRILHKPDLAAEPDLPEAVRDRLRRHGNASVVHVPLLWQDRGIGQLLVARTPPKPFSDKELSLLQTFADQAVIAIENARLFNETKEALEQQSASAEILSVISNSVADAKPVFGKILESCKHLFGGDELDVLLVDEHGQLNIAAYIGASHDVVAATFPAPVERTPAGRAIRERRVMHWPDLVDGEDVPGVLRKMAKLIGYRSMVFAPMLWEDRGIGAIGVARSTGPFKPKELAMLQTFADQAVIAIQNARLFNETKEALERQTATADILKVIASSPDDVQPVLDAVVKAATRFGGAEDAEVALCEGDEIVVSAHEGPIQHDVGRRGTLDRASLTGRSILDGQTMQVADMLAAAAAELTTSQHLAHKFGWRAIVAVPMMRERKALGVLFLRRVQPGAFAARQIALLETFADQAVIAIENARLFEELRARTRDLTEALQMQTATSDVLKVISRSAFDLQAVFNTLVSSAVELGGALTGTICVRDGDVFRYRDTIGAEHTSKLAQYLRDNPATPGRSTIAGRVLLSGEVERIPDCLVDPEYVVPMGSLATNVRSLLGVPLLRNEGVEGAIILTRGEPGHFTDRQVEIVQIFADQAVIALENVRLFEEVRARTKELAASLDDLQKAQDRLVQTEKLASLGQLTAGIAHEIKNPLNFVNNFSALSAELVDELDETLAPAPLNQQMRGEIGELTQMLKSNLEKVVQHGRRADSIVKNMLLHSREGSGEHRSADINALVEESLNLAYHGARAEKPGFNITLQRTLDPDGGEVELYPQEITRALLNLISNGFYAATKRKSEAGDETFEPVLSAATKNLGETVEIRIRDNGTGIPAEVKEKMFNPFFTTKPAGEGTGLGLSMSHDIIVKQHGGRIDVETEPGVFTEFIITLPRNAAKPVHSGGTN